MKRMLTFLLLMPLVALAGMTYYVNGTTGVDSNSGLSATAAKKTIQAAIDVAAAGSTIRVAAGTYQPITTGNKRLTISSVSGRETTIIDGGGIRRCAYLGDSTNECATVLNGFTLTNGYLYISWQGQGGAGARGGTLNDCAIVGCRIGGSWSGYGGEGGGVSDSVVCRCIVSDCSALAGGGLSYSAVELSVVKNCYARDDSGGAHLCVLRDCLVSNNYGYNTGGGSCGSAMAGSKAYNCTIVNNDARSGGTINGGELYNCIVYGNTPVNVEQGWNSHESACRMYSCVTNDPSFVDFEGEDYRLTAGSPCIDAGDNSFVSGAKDLDGNVRIANGTVDVGCYEYGSSPTITDGLIAWYKFDGNANDSSGNWNHGIVHGATLTTDRFGNANRAYAFDGNDWIEAVDSTSLRSPTNAFTISVWFNQSAWYENVLGLWGSIVEKGDSRQYGLQLAYHPHGSSYWCYEGVDGYHIGGTGAGDVTNVCKEIALNRWQHVTITCDGSKTVAYLDGEKVGEIDAVDMPRNPNNEPLYIGYDLSGGDEYFIGSLDDLRIYNRALSAAEVSAICNEGSAGFVCTQYNFNQRITSLSDAEACIVDQGRWRGLPVTREYPTISFDGQSASNYVPCATAFVAVPFPGHTSISNHTDYMAVRANGTVYIPSAGNWTFDCGHDDGFRVKLTGNGRTYEFEDDSETYYVHTTRTFNIATAGIYQVSLLYFEMEGGSVWDFSVARGVHDRFDASVFKLVGTEESGITHVGQGTSVVYRTVTFNANGGAAVSSRRVEDGAAVGTLPTATKNGAEFLGWFTEATGGTQVTATRTITEDVTFYAHWREIALSEAIGGGAYAITTGGDANWFAESTNKVEGAYAAQSGAIGGGQASWMQMTITGAKQVSFWWKVSSESNYDFLKFYVDGVEKKSISGTGGDWSQETVQVTGTGTHTLKWQYSKDGSVNNGDDCGWVDQLVVTDVQIGPSTTYYVNGTTGSDSNSGLSENAAKKTIQAAIDGATEGCTIQVSSGTYAPFVVTSQVIRIEGVEGPLTTFIDGGARYERGNGLVLSEDLNSSDATNVIVRGFTIQHLCNVNGGSIQNCIVRENNCWSLGGGAVNGAVVENCLIINNKGMNGAAGDKCLFRNCTIVGNYARDLDGVCLSSVLVNCIVYGNGNNNRQTWQYYFDQSWISRLGYREVNVYVGDPRFVDAESGDYRLASDSPCIDAGDNSYVTGMLDLNGNARIANGVVDIGCYEYGSACGRYMVVDLSGGTSASRYPVHYMDSEPTGGWCDEYKTTKLVLRRIDEADEPYYIGIFEFTQRQWELVMGTRPSFNRKESCYASRPVEQVSYEMIRGGLDEIGQGTLLNRLGTNTGIIFDLPTASQFKTASRAGQASDVTTGRGKYAQAILWGEPERDQDTNHIFATAAVGSYQPNEWGVFDMLGNVQEFVRDEINDTNCYSVGGSWNRFESLCSSELSSTYRDRDIHELAWTSIADGFRVVAGVASEPETVLQIVFNGNGGMPARYVRRVEDGAAVGALPTVTKNGAEFLGWFTAATGGTQVTATRTITEDVTFYAHWREIPLSDAIGGGTYVITTGGDGNWFAESTNKVEGAYAAQSGAIGDGQSSWMQTTVTGANDVSFKWMVSSEEEYDWLKVYVDGVEKDAISGSVSWREKALSITGEGTHVIKWVYSKDGSQSSGDDCGRVDALTVTPRPEVWNVTFNANGGNIPVAAKSVVDGTAVGGLPTVTRTGYAFVGWFTETVGGTEVTAATIVSSDVTYYAHWTPISYAITYVDTKGAVNSNPATYTIEDAVTFWALPNVDGWKFVGWSNAGIARGSIGAVTVEANWERIAPPVDPREDDDPMDASIANTYDGVIVDADGLPMGYITVKAAKASGKGDAKVSKVTATIQMAGEAKKVTIKANVAVAEATVTQAAADGRVLDLTFSRYGIWGTFDGYEIDGVRNLLASTAKSDKGTDAKNAAESVYAALKGNYVMAFGDENGYNGLSVNVMTKGKVKVSGKLSNGTRVATTSQLIVGSDYSVIPVIYTKKDTSLAFNIYFTNDGSEAEVFGYYDAVISPVSGLDSGLSFYLGDAICDLFDESYTLCDEFLPYDLSVAPVSSAKWSVANGAKAGKIKVVNGEVVDTMESENPSGLKLTFKANTGAFSGSFKVYALDTKGKLKNFTATVSGVVVDGLGYGVATIKGRGSCAVVIAE